MWQKTGQLREHRQRTDDYGTASSMAPKSQTVTPPDPGGRLGGSTELGEWQRAGTSLIFFQRGSIPHPWRWLHEVPWETAWVKITQDFALLRRPERAASSKPVADCPSQQHPPQLLVPNPHLYARLAHSPHELIAHAGEAELHQNDANTLISGCSHGRGTQDGFRILGYSSPQLYPSVWVWRWRGEPVRCPLQSTAPQGSEGGSWCPATWTPSNLDAPLCFSDQAGERGKHLSL